MRHILKHLNLLDKIFIVLFLVLAVVAGITGDWRGVVFLVMFVILIFISGAKDMTISHLEQLVELQFKLLEDLTKAVGGSKIVKTTTTEFTLEKSKKAEGKKPNEKKQRNEDTANAGRSRSSSSRKRTASKTAKSEGAGTASVSNRKSKATKKNS